MTAPDNVITLADLASVPQWVAWRNEERDGKTTKVPYFSPGMRAEANNPSTWLTHDAAVALAQIIINGTGGGVGIELGPCGECWIIGVDLDACRDPATGVIEPWAMEVIERFGTYGEVSPSGTGVKLFGLTDPADVPALRTLMGTTHGRQFKRTNGGAHPPAIELYTSSRYFATTWQALDDSLPELRTVPLTDFRWLIEHAGPEFSGKARTNSKTSGGGADGGGAGDAAGILHRLNTAAKHSRLVETALRNAATMRGGSRSEGALGLGAALKRAGWSYQDMKAALLVCPATAEWANESAGDDRQFRRIWERGSDTSGDNNDAHSEHSGLDPLWCDTDDWVEADIPKRPWIAPGRPLRGSVTLVTGPPSGMKSSLMLAWGCSLALGIDCGRFHPVTAGASIVYNVEDNATEQRRRLSAAARQFGAKPADIAGKVIRTGPSGVGTLLTRDDAGRVHFTPAMNRLEHLIIQHKVDVLFVDPLSELHTSEENDNGAMRVIVARFRELAVKYNIAVCILHHTRKGGAGSAGDLDIARGASAIIGAVRVALTLCGMSEDDAKAFGLPIDTLARSHYVRLDDAKQNYAAVLDAEWFEKVPHPLDNGEACPQQSPGRHRRRNRDRQPRWSRWPPRSRAEPQQARPTRPSCRKTLDQ
jgi:hypothetical protein